MLKRENQKKVNKMGYPKVLENTEVCITVTTDGVKLYGNKDAFFTLSEWMAWIATSNEKEHYECHVGFHLLNDEAFVNVNKRNVYFLFDETVFKVVHSEKDAFFDLTFMILQDSELGELRKFAKIGILPKEFQNDRSERQDEYIEGKEVFPDVLGSANEPMNKEQKIELSNKLQPIKALLELMKEGKSLPENLIKIASENLDQLLKNK